MSAYQHLRHLLRFRWFRRLFAVRLTSQLGDGVFQVALASYALFSDRQPSPAAIATALAVTLLPFSALGPFAGVFLDRWSRRQVLAWANFIRVGILAAVGGVLVLDLPEPVFYAVVLLCLSVNRFLLAGLSAALPHTVVAADLVTANALTPTAGTLSYVLGVGLGGLMRAGWRGLGADGDLAVVATAAVLYAGAGLLALRIPKRLLGPDPGPGRPTSVQAVRHVVRGLADGLSHLSARRQPSAALAAITAHRYWVGISTVMIVLLFRNHLHPAGDQDAAFADLALVTLAGGAGFFAAALVTPSATERVGPRRWIVLLLAVTALLQVVPTALFTRPALMAAAVGLGFGAQGIKICVDTLVQTGVEDPFRGRVFSLYDVLFNVAFTAAAATAALVLPIDGRSYPVLLVVAAGYLTTAVCYAAVTRGTESPVPVAGAEWTSPT